MTVFEKDRVLEYRALGWSYKEIAKKLELSVDSIRGVCRRQAVKENDNTCACCGLTLIQLPRRKKKRFCSDRCRYKWWSDHPEKRDKNTMYRFVCPACSKEFYSEHKNRKYCSRMCYYEARKGRNVQDGQ